MTASSPTAIRVATYNLYLGADLTVIFAAASPEDLAERAQLVQEQVEATDFGARAEAIAAILVRELVDLVGLQEVARWTRAGETTHGRAEIWLDFLGLLLDALARAGEVYDVHACTANFRGTAHVAGGAETSVLGHNVILVRRGGPVRVTAEGIQDFSTTLDIQTGMPDLVLNVARSWGWVDATADGRELRFVNTHHEAWDETVRDAQRDELIAALEDCDRSVVLVGDFNATPDHVGMPGTFVDAWTAAGDGGDGFTCGQTPGLTGLASGLRSRIDYVWVRGAGVDRCTVVGGRAEDRTTSGLWPSDHAGVVAHLSL